MPTAEPAGARLPGAITPRANPIATFLLVFTALLITSRVMEFLAPLGVGRLRLVLVTCALGLIVATLGGGLLEALKSPPGIFLTLFTGWLMLSTPFSVWRGGSARMLINEWAPSLVVFFVMAGLAVTLGQLRKVVLAAACGTLLAGVLLIWLGRFEQGRFSLSAGTFGNANLLAFQLLFGAPLCLYWLIESRMLVRLLLLAALAPSAYAVLLSGSRGGLIILALLVLLMLARFSWFGRIAVLFAAALLLGALTLVPRDVRQRYRAILATGEDASDSALASALESEGTRVVHLRDSLVLTLQHPAFGVGPGLFSVAAAEYAENQGRQALWRETHNAYTQVSSECGIPALIVFLALLVWSWRVIGRVDRAARALGRRDIQNLAFCLRMSLAVYAANGVFSSNAYGYHLPLVAALTLALYRTTRPMLVQDTALKTDTQVQERNLPAGRTSRPGNPVAALKRAPPRAKNAGDWV